MAKARPTRLYRCIRWSVLHAYPRMTLVGVENLPDGAAVIVGNHAQMYGPLNAELYFPKPSYTWCAAQMMTLSEVPGYAFQDFWSQKPASSRWLFRVASYLIAPLSVCIFNNADTIPVYHDTRLRLTFRETLERLDAGARVIIFPEHDAPGNRLLSDFQDRFIDLARFYYRQTGRALPFVPMYSAPALRRIVIGRPTLFAPDAPLNEERARVKRYLMEEITTMAEALPPHTVVPYRNIAKRDYPQNRP